MNQILSTSMPNDKKKTKKAKKSYNNAPTDIIKITRFFAIILIIFGIFMVGTGSYALYKGDKEKTSEPTKPTITAERIEETRILLKVMGQKAIDKVSYSWNDGQTTTLNGNNGKYLEQKIDIPTGSNQLKVTAIDVDGSENTFQNQYDLNSNIQLEALNNGKIKISYEGDTPISYMTYRWDDEEETRFDINSTTISQEIEARKGNHTLTVIIVDVNNKTETKVQEITGVSKPTLEVTTDAAKENFVVKATDETGLDKILFVINEDENKKYMVRASGNTEYEFKYPLEEGENRIKIEVINVDGISTEAAVLFRK